MPLDRYKAKRDFDTTPEPEGGRTSRTTNRYIIQKHDATRLHYDLRLQVGNVLASWAVPKGPSLNPTDKRLAVHVEDHPLEYASFEGTIPQGQYGGGTVMLWDRGTWTCEEANAAKAIARGKLTFTLHGERVKGSWALVRMRGRTQTRSDDDNKDNWLLIKHEDEHASTTRDLTNEFTTSITTRRTMEEIAASDGTSTPTARRTKARSRHVAPVTSPAQRETATRDRAKKNSPQKNTAPQEAAPASDVNDLADVAKSIKARMPREVGPQLCTLADAAPTGPQWIHEIKFDEYRLVAYKGPKGVTLFTRAGHNWTRRFGPIAEAIATLPVPTAIIDGEACVLDAHGHTDFQSLQGAIKSQRFTRLVFFAFDLLYLDGFDLRSCRLIDRKELLRGLMARTPQGARRGTRRDTPEGVLRYSDHVVGGGDAVRQNACELALEGIICKRADAPYESGRSRSWVKVKCSRRQEFVIIGFTKPEGSRTHFGALLLGAYTAPNTLTYMGRVGTGFTRATLRDLKVQLDARTRATCPADEPLTREVSRGVTWVTPELVAEVEFTQMTDEGRLRHPSFQGLREDKPARLVRVEHPVSVEESPEKPKGQRQPAAASKGSKSQTPKRSEHPTALPATKPTNTNARARESKPRPRSSARATSSAEGPSTVAGVHLTHPDRVLYPEDQITKLDIATYYNSLGNRILPFLINRPLSTVRCPQGHTGQCFFQKHLRSTFGPPVTSIRVEESDGPADYIAIDSLQGLIALVQFGVLEIHPWGSMGTDLEYPDMLTFDLDPSEEVSTNAVKDAAIAVRERLASIGLVPFLKTSGGKGLHVVVPLVPDVEWDNAKEFCRQVALSMAASEPAKYLAVMSKAKRKGKIFVDYLRNGRGATSVAAYSTRARPGAPVSMPIPWDALSSISSFAQFTVTNAPAFVTSQKRDPWADFDASRRSLRKLAAGRA